MNHDPNQEIYVAEIVHQPSGPGETSGGATTSRSCLIPCAIILGLCLILMVGGGFAIWKAIAPPDLMVQTEAEVTAGRLEHYQQVRNAFSKNVSPEDHAEYQQICQLIGRVAEFANDEVNPELHECIDFQRYAREVRRNPELNNFAYFGNSILAISVRERTVGPIPFSDYQIFEIEELNANERKIVLQTYGVYEGVSPYVWWVARTDENQWKLYDWEPLEYGVRDSKETAVLMGEPDYSKNLAYEKYVDTVTMFLKESTTGHTERTTKRLLECKSLVLNEAIADGTFLNIAMHFESEDYTDEALTFLDLVLDMDKTPGAYLLRGEILLEKHKFPEAAECFENYFAIVGPTFGILEHLANAYEGTGDHAKELAIRRQAIGYIKDSYSTNLASAVLLESRENLPDLFSQVDALPDSKTWYLSLLEQFNGNPFVIRKLQALADYLEKDESQRDVATRTNAELAFATGEISRGFKLIGNPELMAEEDHRYQFWYKAIEMGVVADAFEDSTEKQQDFEFLSSIYDEYDYGFSAQDYLKVAVLAIKNSPETAMFHHAAGVASYDDVDYQTAIGYLNSAKEKFGSNFDEYIIEYNAERLAFSHYHLGDLGKAIKAVDEFGKISLLHLAASDGKLTEFQSLIESLGDEPEQQEYFRACLLMEQGEFEQAKSSFIKIINNKEPNEYGYNDTYREASMLIKCCTKEGDVLDAFRKVSDSNVFSQLSARLLADQDWRRANELAELAREELSKQNAEWLELPAVLDLEHKILWFQDQFKELASTQRYDKDAEALEFHLEYPCPNLEYVFRAALRSGNSSLAERIVKLASKQGSSNSEIQILWALHQNDHEEFKRLKNRFTYTANNILSDPDVPELDELQREKLLGDDARELDLQPVYGGQRLTLLFDGPPVLSTAMLDALANSVFSNPVTVQQLDDPENNRPAWLICSNNVVVSVQASGRLQVAANRGSGELETAIENHTDTLRIQVDSLNWETKVPKQICLEIVDRLEFENATAISWNYHWMNWKDGLATLRRLKTRELLVSEFEDTVPTKPVDVASNPAEPARTAKFQYALAEAWHAFKNSDSNDKQLIVSLPVSTGLVSETIRIDVTDIETHFWGGTDLIGELMDKILLDPSVDVGESVRCETSQAFRWSLRIGDQEKSGER